MVFQNRVINEESKSTIPVLRLLPRLGRVLFRSLDDWLPGSAPLGTVWVAFKTDPARREHVLSRLLYVLSASCVLLLLWVRSELLGYLPLPEEKKKRFPPSAGRHEAQRVGVPRRNEGATCMSLFDIL